jgi:hypothetical protein
MEHTPINQVTEEPIKPKKQYRTDPEYVKSYYLEKLQGVEYHCNICDRTVGIYNRGTHFRSKLHIRLAKIAKHNEENYSEFD